MNLQEVQQLVENDLKSKNIPATIESITDRKTFWDIELRFAYDALAAVCFQKGDEQNDLHYMDEAFARYKDHILSNPYKIGEFLILAQHFGWLDENGKPTVTYVGEEAVISLDQFNRVIKRCNE